MELREVRVEFRRTVSDAAYGNETYSVAFTATVDVDEAPRAVAFHLAAEAHKVVMSRLRGSTNEQVCRAVETPEERPARQERERTERVAEREHWRVQAEREAAEREARFGPVPAPDDGDKEEDEDDSADPPTEGLVGFILPARPSFGAQVDKRLGSSHERPVPARLRELDPRYRADRLFELVADLSDGLVAHAKSPGEHGKVGDDVIREAALSVAVMAAQVWLATTGWPEGTPDPTLERPPTS